jgi:hypothetical protein
MLLREFFPGVIPPKDAGPGGNAGKPVGSGREWKKQGAWPYADPTEDVSDLDDVPPRIAARLSKKIGSVVARRDMGYARVDAGNFLGQAGTFNALAEGGVGFMPNSIVPLVHINRMTNRTQDLNDPMQIPNVTYGPGVKNRTGTIYGTSHPSVLAGDEDGSFIPGMGDILPDRDERSLLKARKRFQDLQDKNYGHALSSKGHPVIVGERK